MIKINLLGVPKPKRGKRSGGAAPDMGAGGGEGMNPLIPLVLAAVVCAGGSHRRPPRLGPRRTTTWSSSPLARPPPPSPNDQAHLPGPRE